MKSALGAVGLLLLVHLLPRSAGAATQVGIRGGQARATGEVVRVGGEPGGMGFRGATLELGLLPLVGLEMAWERSRGDFGSRWSATDDDDHGGGGTYEDQSYLVTGKLHIPIPGPIGVHGGVGGSLHRIEVRLHNDGAAGEEALGGLRDGDHDWEVHVVTGMSVQVPGAPLLVYGECRFPGVERLRELRYGSAYAGLNLRLD